MKDSTEDVDDEQNQRVLLEAQSICTKLEVNSNMFDLLAPRYTRSSQVARHNCHCISTLSISFLSLMPLAVPVDTLPILIFPCLHLPRQVSLAPDESFKRRRVIWRRQGTRRCSARQLRHRIQHEFPVCPVHGACHRLRA